MKSLPSLLLVLVLASVITGCGSLDPTGPYKGNKVLYSADLTIATAYDVIDGFLIWENANRGTAACPRSVTAAADDLRGKAPAAFAEALAARDAYANASTSANASKLQTTLMALQQLVSVANKFLIPAKMPAKVKVAMLENER